MEVLFICPRPICLASTIESSVGNMFPMNVMGQLDDGYFGFGLKDARSPSNLVNRTRRIALSTIPMQQGDLGYKLGPNHAKKNGIDWNDLPFATKQSPNFGIPIPAFAFRVREMEVENARKLGSHIFFVGRVVRDERFSDGMEWCVVHGNYQAWRLKSRPSSDRVFDRGRRSCETRYGHRDWAHLMSVLHQMRTAIKDGIFGETILPEEFATGIPDPQQEISVMLEGMAAPIDVTFRHSTACSDPFLLAIAFDEGHLPNEQSCAASA